MGVSGLRRFEFDRRFDLSHLSDADRARTLEAEAEIRDEIERKQAEAEAIKAVARAEGYQAGLEAARKEREAELGDAVARLNNNLERAFIQAAEFHGEVTLDAVALAVAIGEGLAGELFKANPLGCAQHAISTALIEQFERPRMTIKVCPVDRAELAAFVDSKINLTGYEGRIIFQDDANLQSGDCLIEWSDGGIRAVMTERRERVLGELLDLVATREGRLDDHEAA